MGPPVSAGVTYFKGPYTQIATDADLEFDQAAVPENRYGIPVENQIRGLRFRACGTDGKLSNVFETLVTVIA